MLELTEVAKWLTDKLNEKGLLNTPIYSFNINAEVGKNKGENVVNGILISETPKITPIADIKDYKYKLRVTLSVTAPTGNFNLKNVENIVGAVAEEYNGKSIDFSNGKGITTFTLTGTKDFKIDAGQGGIVPITFYLDINYTEDLITSVNKVWKLNGYTIPFLSESVIIEKNGRITPINDRRYQQVFMRTQLKWYHFRFPFVDNELCNMLYKDLLEGDMNKKYTLTYYDGVNYTAENPYTTTVVIFRNGDADSQKPDTAMFDIMFADADDGKNRIRYELGVFDNPFDSSTDNTRWFDDEVEQILYYENKINSAMVFNELPAPNLNSLALTNQIYQNNYYQYLDLGEFGIHPTYEQAIERNLFYQSTDVYGIIYLSVSTLTKTEYNSYTGALYTEEHYNIFNLVNKNFAVIRVKGLPFRQLSRKPNTRLQAIFINLYYYDSTTQTYKSVNSLTNAQYNALNYVYTDRQYFYYNVQNATIGANNQVLYDLKLDSVQTWLFNKDLIIQDSFIEKAHLNRWVSKYTKPDTRPSFSEISNNVNKGLYYYYPGGTDAYYNNPDELVLLIGSNFANEDEYLTTVNANAIRIRSFEFDATPQSPLFMREDIKDVPKILTNRTELKFTGLSSDVVNWYNDNILCWCYIFANTPQKYRIYTPFGSHEAGDLNPGTITHDFTSSGDDVEGGYCIFAYPIYKGSHKIKTRIYNSAETEYVDKIWSVEAFKDFANSKILGDENSDYQLAKVYSIKISLKPPFELFKLANLLQTSYFISDNDLYFNFVLESGNSWLNNGKGTVLNNLSSYIFKSNSNYSMVTVHNDSKVPNSLILKDSILPRFEFSRSEINNASGNDLIEQNPKLNASDYKQLVIQFEGETKNFDIQKLNQKCAFGYYEMLTPSTTRSSINLVTSGNNTLYNALYSVSYEGMISQNDTTIPYSISAYGNFIANNKNFYSAFQFNQNMSKLQGMLGIFTGGAKSILTQASGAVQYNASYKDANGTQIPSSISPNISGDGGTGSILDITKGGYELAISQASKQAQFDFTIDNMQNAPATLKQANGDVIFSNSLLETKFYINLYKGVDHDIKIAHSLMQLKGYNYETFGKVKDFCNIRSTYNYVKAILGNITGVPMSNIMRADLRERFSNGIRFWKTDTIDYSVSNPEIWISSEYKTFEDWKNNQ